MDAVEKISKTALFLARKHAAEFDLLEPDGVGSLGVVFTEAVPVVLKRESRSSRELFFGLELRSREDRFWHFTASPAESKISSFRLDSQPCFLSAAIRDRASWKKVLWGADFSKFKRIWAESFSESGEEPFWSYCELGDCADELDLDVDVLASSFLETAFSKLYLWTSQDLSFAQSYFWLDVADAGSCPEKMWLEIAVSGEGEERL